MQKENALQILASRVLCVEPDKYRVKVTNVNLFSRPDGTMVNIVGVAAMTPYLVQKAKETLKRLKEEGSDDFQEITNTNLSTSRRLGIDWTPKKGEYVNIIVDYVPTKEDPSVNALLIIGMEQIAVAKSVSINLNNSLLNCRLSL